MPPLFLKEKYKKEIRENVQISTFSFLNKTNKYLKQETLHVVKVTMMLRLDFVLKISLFSGASLKPIQQSMMEFFCKNNKLLTEEKLYHRCSLGVKYAFGFNCSYLLIDQIYC